MIGLDIGTSSTKAVAVDADGTVVAAVSGEHGISRPRPGWFEQDADAVWWDQTCELLRLLTASEPVARSAVAAVAVSGMGPCVLLADASGSPLGPAILYGIDMRATAEIDELTERLGAERILARGGSALTSQAVGPKLLWLQRHKPDLWNAARGWYSTSSFLVKKLTGKYVIDHHTASQCDPMYDIVTQDWAHDWASILSPGIPLPELAWSDEVIGNVTAHAAASTGLPQGTQVLAGTVDAWAEAHSVGVRHEHDLMIMYGSTLFLVGVDHHTKAHPGLWRTAGLSPRTLTLSAGMATSGLLTQWIAETTGRPLAELASSAERVPAGADGLAILPYFAGERSPLFDPGARGALLGLTLAHTPAHLMRAAFEAVAMGVRHNLEAFNSVTDGGAQWRAVAVGGAAAGDLWPQIVTDVTGLPQVIPEQTIGACYGDALLAATAVGIVPRDTCWMKPARSTHRRTELENLYNERYALYRDLYAATRPLIDRL